MRGVFVDANDSLDEIFDRSENTIEIYGKDKRGREYYQNWILRVVDDKANPSPVCLMNDSLRECLHL